MTGKQRTTYEYRKDHVLAKFLMANIVAILLFFDGSLSILGYSALMVWVFAVNPIQYVLEVVLKHKHKVPPI